MDGIDRLRSRLEAADADANILRKMVAFVEDIGVDGVDEFVATWLDTRAGTPCGRVAIRQIVAERPGIWTLGALRAGFDERGWSTTAKAIEVSVARMMAGGECQRVGRGRYVFPADFG